MYNCYLLSWVWYFFAFYFTGLIAQFETKLVVQKFSPLDFNIVHIYVVPSRPTPCCQLWGADRVLASLWKPVPLYFYLRPLQGRRLGTLSIVTGETRISHLDAESFHIQITKQISFWGLSLQTNSPLCNKIPPKPFLTNQSVSCLTARNVPMSDSWHHYWNRIKERPP